MIGLICFLFSMPNGPIKSDHQSSDKHSFSVGTSTDELSAVMVSKVGSCSTDGKVSLSSSGQSSSSISAVSASGVYASSSPVILPSRDGLAPSVGDAIKHEGGTHQSTVDTASDISNKIGGSELSFLQETIASEKVHTFVNGKVQDNFHEIEEGKVLNTSQAASPSSSITGASGSRPSSNYSNRSQHPIAPSKGIIFFQNS